MSEKVNEALQELKDRAFIRDLIDTKPTNEQLMKKYSKQYSFKTQREMFRKFEELRKKYNIEIPKQQLTEEEKRNMQDLSKFLKRGLRT